MNLMSTPNWSLCIKIHIIPYYDNTRYKQRRMVSEFHYKAGFKVHTAALTSVWSHSKNCSR